MQRVWVGFGLEPAKERIAADTSPGQPRRVGTRVRILQRKPGG